MSTEYAGNDSYPVTITIPTDDDEGDAAAYDVPFEQLADRTHYLKLRLDEGIGFELTDAILHGDTTFPDGTIDATGITDLTVVASNAVTIAAAAGEAFLGGNTVALGSTTTITLTATTDVIVTAGGDINVSAGDDIIITGAAGSVLDLWGGRVVVPASGGPIELATDVLLGGGTGDTTTVQGDLVANVDASVGGDLDVTGASTLGGNTLVQAKLFFGSAGTMKLRRIAGVNADHTYVVTDAMLVMVPTLSATRTYDIDVTGAEDGHFMIFSMASDATSANGNGIVLRRAGGGLQIGPSIVKGTQIDWMMIVFDGANWQPALWGQS